MTKIELKRSGCFAVAGVVRYRSGDKRFIPDGDLEYTYYPSPVSRKRPDWVLPLTIGIGAAKGSGALGALLFEVYQAVDGGQFRLAAMGIRALLEQVMIAKVGDHRTFNEKLDAFQKEATSHF